MRTPLLVLELLTLLLIPEPGVSQFGFQTKRCRDCPKNKDKDVEDPGMFQYALDGQVSEKYLKCPHSEDIRFQLKNEIICAQNHRSWVKQLMQCLDTKNCDSLSSHLTNDKPSTTMIVPTTALVTSLNPSTRGSDHNIGKSTEATDPKAATPTASFGAPRDLGTTAIDLNKANVNLRQGNDEPPEESNIEHHDGKMKNMRTAIISLIAIVLVMAAVGVGLYCRKRKRNEFNPPCGSVEYTATASQDSILTVNSEQ